MSRGKIIDIEIDNNNTNLVNNVANNLHIFPNPNNGQELYLQLLDKANIEFVEICDLSGKVHLKQNAVNNQFLSLKGLETGLYLVSIYTSEGNSYTKKLSIIK